jgi:ribosomal protein S18 acetylase RimI-like enzyme
MTMMFASSAAATIRSLLALPSACEDSLKFDRRYPELCPHVPRPLLGHGLSSLFLVCWVSELCVVVLKKPTTTPTPTCTYPRLIRVRQSDVVRKQQSHNGSVPHDVSNSSYSIHIKIMSIMMLLSLLLTLTASCPATSFYLHTTSSSSRLVTTRPHLFGLGLGRTTDTDNVIATKDYFIEKVSTKARALDIKVFRGFSMSATEYILEQQNIGNEISETMAIDHLMKNYNEHGQYIMKNNELLLYEREDYFIALYNGTDTVCGLSMARQNGLAGLVSAQLRRQAPPIVGPSQDGTPSILVLSSSIPIPSSHLYVANMRVVDNMQRRGIGMALLSSIRDYVNTLGEENIPLVLSVDSDNVNAIRLYENFGFEYLERNSDWGTMILIR